MVTEKQERKIAEGLDKLIPKNLAANRYLKTGILIAMDSNKVNMKKKIYPQIAAEYSLSINGLKQYLAGTIATCFDKDPSKFKEFFGHFNCNTPAKFIKAFVEKMKAEE